MAEARTQKNGQLLNPGRNLSTNWKAKSSNGVGVRRCCIVLHGEHEVSGEHSDKRSGKF